MFDLQPHHLAAAGVVAVIVIGGIFAVLRKSPTHGGRSVTSNVLLTDSAARYSVPLIKKESISHDTRRFRFGLPEGKVLGLPTGKHISVAATIGDKPVSRPYTPTTIDDDGHAYFDLVVKVYKAGVNPRFPDGGKLSQWLDTLNVGDAASIRGPIGKIHYNGCGTWTVGPTRLPGTFRRLGMVAGGTGITPMYQVIRAIVADRADTTSASLVYANQTVNDILLRDELEALPAQSSRFSVFLSVDRDAPPGWRGGTGFVTQQMLAQNLPAPAADVLVLLCGPPPMMAAMKGHLQTIGHAEAQILTF
eukprot:TRINITY_DN5540_c0_g2_i1.p1 TRINITY_DN5540_c0_g2~~TRINITY_DN5540_c0_g2_i1.p1  ORF type:complete len:305 (+),score=58.56 TRINITY_DN5540_c0_g2_i1:110-1024(+)